MHHKFGVAILKILLFGYWCLKNCHKVAAILDFWHFFGNKWPKSKIFTIASPNLWNALQEISIPNFKSLAFFLFKWMYFLWVFSIGIWRVCTYCIYMKLPIFKKSSLRLGILFFMRIFASFFMSTWSFWPPIFPGPPLPVAVTPKCVHGD